MNEQKIIAFPEDEKQATEEIVKEFSKLPKEEKKAIYHMIQGVKLIVESNTEKQAV